jgi:hypothetical protein
MAVAALNAASSTLDSQLGTRAGMVGTLKGRLTTLASSTVGGAEDANEEQRQNNDRAEHPTPVGGHPIPE